jgi:succinate dehydrogenase/fumarate reductase flavoprotein subunit
VVDGDGSPIAGLYAAGNDAASIMGGEYTGAGITLGPGLTFGYIAANHIADTAAATLAAQAAPAQDRRVAQPA